MDLVKCIRDKDLYITVSTDTCTFTHNHSTHKNILRKQLAVDLITSFNMALFSNKTRAKALAVRLRVILAKRPSYLTKCHLSGKFVVVYFLILCSFKLTSIFNKIAIPNNKFQMASGHGSHCLIESPTILSSMPGPWAWHDCAARPYQISVNSSFKHIHITSINTIIWQFVPFIYHPL